MGRGIKKVIQQTKSKPARPSTKRSRKHSYQGFEQINGKHEFRDRVSSAIIPYDARWKKSGRVAYFNFNLAEEAGLIPKGHLHKMNVRLERVILDTFGVQIINEYDIENNVRIKKEERLPHDFFATRYLQLQHPDRTGGTSGDGRSIWNGQIKHGGSVWDVTSCGTGATRLSPATAIEGRFFKTGDLTVSYGCGLSDISDGMSAALMSEVFHRNGVATERTLAVIEFPNNTSINVRMGKNLLRPSHFFRYLRSNDFEGLQAIADYHVDRERKNGRVLDYRTKGTRYWKMAEEIALNFARAVARFESEYIFVWLDWDGDNILMDGGIIDYGSVRQFGLFHNEYRYDDVERMSTNLREQRGKARGIVQTFLQIADWLASGKKKTRSQFNRHKLLDLFDQEFERYYRELLLLKLGLAHEHVDYLLKFQSPLVERFQKVFSYFERAKSTRGRHDVVDGITWDAIYCMRDILRELPIVLLVQDGMPEPEDFMEILASSYASEVDRQLTPAKIKKIRQFCKDYQEIMNSVGKKFALTQKKLMLQVSMRSSVINQYDRITGDSIIWVTRQILSDRKKLNFDDLNRVIEDFIEYQKLRPGPARKQVKRLNLIEQDKAEKVRNRIMELLRIYRESL